MNRETIHNASEWINERDIQAMSQVFLDILPQWDMNDNQNDNQFTQCSQMTKDRNLSETRDISIRRMICFLPEHRTCYGQPLPAVVCTRSGRMQCRRNTIYSSRMDVGRSTFPRMSDEKYRPLNTPSKHSRQNFIGLLLILLVHFRSLPARQRQGTKQMSY